MEYAAALADTQAYIDEFCTYAATSYVVVSMGRLWAESPKQFCPPTWHYVEALIEERPSTVIHYATTGKKHNLLNAPGLQLLN